jgi:hypothetical protein
MRSRLTNSPLQTHSLGRPDLVIHLVIATLNVIVNRTKSNAEAHPFQAMAELPIIVGIIITKASDESKIK